MTAAAPSWLPNCSISGSYTRVTLLRPENGRLLVPDAKFASPGYIRDLDMKRVTSGIKRCLE